VTGRADFAVLGLGGIGSAALATLASRGHRVLGFDAHNPPHDKGSSHGETRVIRQAYFEHPSYVPLLKRAYSLWEALEARSGRVLFERCGVLEVGPPDGVVVPGVLRSARDHDLAVECLDPAALRERFPGFEAPPGMVGVFEEDAGFLKVEAAVTAHLAWARSAGAEIHVHSRVHAYRPHAAGVLLETDQGAFDVGAVLLTSGAWLPALAPGLAPFLSVLRKVQIWIQLPSGHPQRQGAPCYLFEMPEGVFYGFPGDASGAMKVAEHTGGELVDPDTLDDLLRPEELDSVAAFLAHVMPSVDCERVLRHATCMYTMTPDEHFVVGAHPGLSRVYLAGGLSGHGFKFATVLGEALADLASGERPAVALHAFDPARLRA
jgi:monomeric sarcosine oxidase